MNNWTKCLNAIAAKKKRFLQDHAEQDWSKVAEKKCKLLNDLQWHYEPDTFRLGRRPGYEMNIGIQINKL